MSTHPWLTTTEAGKLIGVSACTIWRWAHSGVVPAHAVLRVGSHVRISRAWAEQSPAPVAVAEAPCA